MRKGFTSLNKLKATKHERIQNLPENTKCSDCIEQSPHIYVVSSDPNPESFGELYGTGLDALTHSQHPECCRIQ